MPSLFTLQASVASLAILLLLLVKVFAFVDALTRRTDAYVAAGKLTKPAWCLILGLSAVAAFVFPSVFGLLSIVGTVAAFVYLIDVRPALRSVTRR